MTIDRKTYVKPTVKKRECLAQIAQNQVSTSAPVDNGLRDISDRRLKTDIHHLGTFNGFDIHLYRYIGDQRMFAGVMAQDLLNDPRHRDAVSVSDAGFYRVDTSKLDLHFERSAEMREAGKRAEVLAASQLH
ncbi:MAG: tail fiber domain-containing protein [Pseudomonadota bacterium]